MNSTFASSQHNEDDAESQAGIKRRALTPAAPSWILPGTTRHLATTECVSTCKISEMRMTVFTRQTRTLAELASGVLVQLPQRIRQLHSLKINHLELQLPVPFVSTAIGVEPGAISTVTISFPTTIVLSIAEYGPIQSIASDLSVISPNMFICCKRDSTDTTYTAYPETKHMPPLTTMSSLDRLTLRLQRLNPTNALAPLTIEQNLSSFLTDGGTNTAVLTQTRTEYPDVVNVTLTFLAEVVYEPNIDGGVRC